MTSQSDVRGKPFRLVAHDKRQNTYLGTVASVTPSSLVLLSPLPAIPDRILELQLECTDPNMGLHGGYLGVRVLWCEQRTHDFWIGLQVVSVEQQLEQRLHALYPQHPSDELVQVCSLSA